MFIGRQSFKKIYTIVRPDDQSAKYAKGNKNFIKFNKMKWALLKRFSADIHTVNDETLFLGLKTGELTQDT